MADGNDAEDVRTLTEFLEAVFKFVDQDHVLFRGQRRTSWDLQPTLARIDARTPDQTALSVERKIMDSFRREYLPHVTRELRDEWDTLAVAQHHGLYTRMLDWSLSPLAALWFAVRKPAEGDEPGAVFMFQPDSDDYADDLRAQGVSPYTVNRTLFFQPTHLSPRIVAQNGWFAVHAWSEETGFSRLDKLQAYNGRIKRAHIAPERFCDLRDDLDRLGVNEAALFPDLDGLCTHLNWYHTLLSDEKPTETEPSDSAPPDAVKDPGVSPHKNLSG